MSIHWATGRQSIKSNAFKKTGSLRIELCKTLHKTIICFDVYCYKPTKHIIIKEKQNDKQLELQDSSRLVRRHRKKKTNKKHGTKKYP